MAVRRRLMGLDELKRLREVLPVKIKKKLYNALVLPHLFTVVSCGKSTHWNCSKSYIDCRTMA